MIFSAKISFSILLKSLWLAAISKSNFIPFRKNKFAFSHPLHIIFSILLLTDLSYEFIILKFNQIPKIGEKKTSYVVNILLNKKTPSTNKRSKMEDITTLFCSIDDFWKKFEANWKEHLIGISQPKRGPKPELSVSEMMTIVIMFHQPNYRLS